MREPFSPITGEDVSVMRKAREYLEWHGGRVVSGYCLIPGGDSFVKENEKAEMCELAFGDDDDAHTWLRCMPIVGASPTDRSCLVDAVDRIKKLFPRSYVVYVSRGGAGYRLTEMDGDAVIVVPCLLGRDAYKRSNRKDDATRYAGSTSAPL